jgi:hypothetical protein
MGENYADRVSDPPDRDDDDEVDPLEEFLGGVEGDDVKDEGRQESSRRRLERVLPEILKRAIERGLETGLGTITNSSEALRGVVGDVKLPREIVSYVFGAVDDTKNAVVRVVAKEVRDFLSATDVAHELQRALTSLSFEVRTEIRFIPNDAGGVRPEVKAEVEQKRTRNGNGNGKDKPRSAWGFRRRKEDPPPPTPEPEVPEPDEG